MAVGFNVPQCRIPLKQSLTRHAGEFPGLRMILGMANGALVVSEPIYRPQPYVAGKHYVEATAEQMPAAGRAANGPRIH